MPVVQSVLTQVWSVGADAIGGGIPRDDTRRRHDASKKFTGKCNFCHETGHRWAQCVKYKVAQGEKHKNKDKDKGKGKVKDGSCFRCGEHGHKARNCKKARSDGSGKGDW